MSSGSERVGGALVPNHVTQPTHRFIHKLIFTRLYLNFARSMCSFFPTPTNTCFTGIDFHCLTHSQAVHTLKPAGLLFFAGSPLLFVANIAENV